MLKTSPLLRLADEYMFKRLHHFWLKMGRVEGQALISWKSTKIATSFWTTINRRMLKSTQKKGIPHPKTKKKQQWDGKRGANTIKSNPIPAGLVTHYLENNKYQRSSPTAVKVPSLMSDFPAWGSSQETGNPQGIWPSRPMEFDYRTRGNRLHSWRGQTKSCVH